MSASASIDGAHVVDPQPVLGDRRRAARPGRRTSTRRPGPGSTTRYCLADGDRLGLVGDRDVDHAVGAPARRSGRSSSGAYTPSPPPSIIAGPPMPMFEPAVAMTTSQQPSMAALPAKQRPDVMPTSGTRPLTAARTARRPGSRGRTRRRRRCRPAGRRRPRRRTRPAAAGARPARTAGPSCGGSGGPGCRPAPCSRTTCTTVGRPSTVPTPPTSPSAGVRAIEVLERAAPALGGDDQRRRTRRSVPGSTRSSTFSRAVRWPVRRRRVDRVGPAASSPTAWRSSTSARSARVPPTVGAARRPSSLDVRPSPGSTTASTSPACTVSPACDPDLGDTCRRPRRRRRAPSSSTR